jgi:hypothetical protein
MLSDASQTDPRKKYKPIKFQDHQPTKPQMIDEQGNLVEQSANPTPYYLKKRIYTGLDFSALGFPDPLPGGVFV